MKLTITVHFDKRKFFCKKCSEKHKQKAAKGKKPHRPKPEEREGTPQHQHSPSAKSREYRNPNYHEEQQKDVALIIAAPPPKNVEREHK
jgi:hypothetical protein